MVRDFATNFLGESASDASERACNKFEKVDVRKGYWRYFKVQGDLHKLGSPLMADRFDTSRTDKANGPHSIEK